MKFRPCHQDPHTTARVSSRPPSCWQAPVSRQVARLRDCRTILDQKDVDICVVATPDHWHARMTIDALMAGKQVYCEKPMTRTIAEAHAVVDTWKKTGQVMMVGVQSMADPTWRMAHDHIKAGNIGKVLMGQTSYFRNSDVGQWRYYSLTKNMNPSTIDWDMFLGYKFDVDGARLGPTPKEVPFDRAIFGQWRCYWPFGGGMFTDLFVHQTTHLISAMGVRYPRRVVGAGGIYMEYDTRDVPDVATIAADYDEGCQLLISSTMCNDHRIDECIRGHSATLVFDSKPLDPMDPTKGREFGYTILPQKVQSAPKGPSGAVVTEGTWVPGGLKGDDTYALWQNFIECVHKKNQDTFSTPALGAAAFSTVNMGVQSYRTGKTLFWDAEARKPVEADASWAAMWEKRSGTQAEPDQRLGRRGQGSTLNPPEQKLAGPWVDGKDPPRHKAIVMIQKRARNGFLARLISRTYLLGAGGGGGALATAGAAGWQREGACRSGNVSRLDQRWHNVHVGGA